MSHLFPFLLIFIDIISKLVSFSKEGVFEEEVVRVMEEKVSRLLLIEGDENFLLEISRLFYEIEKKRYLVEAAPLQSALQTAEQGRYDLILFDRQHLGSAELELLKNLHDRVFDAPIIMLVDKRNPKLELKAREAGVDEFFVKGKFEPELLECTIRFAIERKRAIRELKASEELYKSLAKSSPFGIWHISSDNFTLYINDKMCRMLEIESPDEIKNQTYHRFFTEESQKRIATERAKREQGTISSYEATLITKKGRRREVVISGGPLFTPDGQFHGFIGTFTDITDRKKAELQLRLAKERAEEATKLKDKFVSLVAHDLRGPLGTILSYLQLVRDENVLQPGGHAMLNFDAAIRVGENMTTLIKNLLDVSRIKTGILKPQMRFFNVRMFVLNVISSLILQAEEKSITIEKEPSSQTRIFGDPILLEQVLQNLVSNAIKFCRRGDRIKISVSENDLITIAVTDNGVGIEPERLNRLFNYETKTSTVGTSGEIGSGLALPLCKDIMKAHDGDLAVESAPGKGSSFFATLPVKRPLVMIIGSDAPTRKRISKYLQNLRVDLVEEDSGKSALRRIKTVGPHLIIFNMQAEKSNGLKYLEQIRKKGNHSEVPIIAITGDDGLDHREKALHAGASDFISKPFSEADLVTRVRLHIG